MPNEQYTREQKILYYKDRLNFAIERAKVSENLFEKIYFSEQAYFITRRLKRLLRDEEI